MLNPHRSPEEREAIKAERQRDWRWCEPCQRKHSPEFDLSPWCERCQAHGPQGHVCKAHFRCLRCKEVKPLSQVQVLLKAEAWLAHRRKVRTPSDYCLECYPLYREELAAELAQRRLERPDPFEGFGRAR